MIAHTPFTVRVVALLALTVSATASASTSLVQSFEGLDDSMTPLAPSDTSLGVGPEHIVQAVNGAGFRVYDRSGNIVLGYSALPVCLSPAQALDGATPKVMYDASAGRWLFAWTMVTTSASPGQQGSYVCIALSSGSAPLPPFTVSMLPISGSVSGPQLTGAAIGSGSYFFGLANDTDHHVIALNRAKLLQSGGQQAEFYSATVAQAGIDVSSVPVEPADPQTLPGPGGLFVGVVNGPTQGSPDRIQILRVIPSWESGSGSTVQALPLIPMTSFAVSACFLSGQACIPQAGLSTRLSTVEGSVAPRAGFRHLDDGSDRLVMSFTNDMGGGRTGVRAYRFLRQPDGSFAMDLESDFGAFDSTSRFGSTIAINRLGTIGLGFIASDAMSHPASRFGIYEPTDPAPPSLQQELTLKASSGSNLSQFFGNHTDVVVDPVDGCSFWVSGQYLDTDSDHWYTRIGRYTQPACTNSLFTDGFE